MQLDFDLLDYILKMIVGEITANQSLQINTSRVISKHNVRLYHNSLRDSRKIY